MGWSLMALNTMVIGNLANYIRQIAIRDNIPNQLAIIANILHSDTDSKSDNGQPKPNLDNLTLLVVTDLLA